MPNDNIDLEVFLQQEAERFGDRAKRVAAEGQGADRPRPSRRQERQMLSSSDDADGIDELDASSAATNARSSVFGASGGLSDSAETEHQAFEDSPMREMLRNPQTLRTAFIASQIFERKF
ncbi:MAG: hypothetical protein Aurels2KO_02280 [Aureliella sp.]